jgi:hypothetical protein
MKFNVFNKKTAIALGSVIMGTSMNVSAGTGDVTAVGLIGAWVDSGASNGTFSYQDGDGASHYANFGADVLPLFTEANAWFDGSIACTTCHFSNGEDSYHEMDLSSYAGLMLGGDVLSKPPGVPLFGESSIGATDYGWDHAKLEGRLRDNRMPPGWTFDITETNRDGACVDVQANTTSFEYGCDTTAIAMLEAWTNAGASETGNLAWGGGLVSFSADILPLFTENDKWFEGSPACTTCHFSNGEASYHEMDLSSYAGLMLGGDVLSKPPGVPLFGESSIGATDYDWGHSKLNSRLRNNRMPPGWAFDITEENRDGPVVNPAYRVALATAKAEQAAAKAVQMEWRDIGKFIKNAAKAMDAGDSSKAIKLLNKAADQGRLGQEQANDQANAGPTMF